MLESVLACTGACIFHPWLKAYASYNWDSVSVWVAGSFLHIWPSLALLPGESSLLGGWLAALWHLQSGRKCLNSSESDFYLHMLFQFHQASFCSIPSDMIKYSTEKKDWFTKTFPFDLTNFWRVCRGNLLNVRVFLSNEKLRGEKRKVNIYTLETFFFANFWKLTVVGCLIPHDVLLLILWVSFQNAREVIKGKIFVNQQSVSNIRILPIHFHIEEWQFNVSACNCAAVITFDTSIAEFRSHLYFSNILLYNKAHTACRQGLTHCVGGHN